MTDNSKSLPFPGDVPDDQAKRALMAEIDASCRVPLLFFFVAGLAWLCGATLLALVASIKLHNPAFLAECPWMTFGRIRPAQLNALVYGFASQTGIGVALWLMCRLCRVPFVAPGLATVAGVFWNAGLALGSIGILAGDSTGIEWLELPRYASPLLFAGYALIAVWGVITFRLRAERRLYASQWYLLAALLWFPWIYATAQILLVFAPVRGVAQGAVNWWFAHNLVGLWLAPIGLGTIYYFVPKITGRPIHNYRLAPVAFWTLALFTGWAGLGNLVGGPLPAWMITVSVAASILMLVPVAVLASNHLGTLCGQLGKLRHSVTLRFVAFGAVAFLVASLQGIVGSLRTYSEIVHFTHRTDAQTQLAVYGFFAMTMFGALYYILPRITGREWPSTGLVSLHFWACGLGVALYVAALSVGGIVQGLGLNDASKPFADVMAGTVPFLKLRTVAVLLIGLGQTGFAGNLAWLFCRVAAPYRRPLVEFVTGNPASAAGK